jgi:hypothetical protein
MAKKEKDRLTETDLDTIFSTNMIEGETETMEGVTGRQLRNAAKSHMISRLKKQEAKTFFERLPKADEYFHTISNGSFDYWSVLSCLIDLCPGPVTEAYVSTWTINHNTCKELFEVLDAGKIKKIWLLSGLYFKKREPAVYARLATGLAERGQRIKCSENHAKVAVLIGNGFTVTMEGSANLTANPRIEQNIVTGSQDVARFHAGWMKEIIEA